jgi:hypothetical protein
LIKSALFWSSNKRTSACIPDRMILPSSNVYLSFNVNLLFNLTYVIYALSLQILIQKMMQNK